MRRACLCLVIVYLETGSARKEMKRRGKPVMMPSRVEGLQDDGKVKIPNITTMAFDNIQEAYEQIKGSRTVGKIVLKRD